jgi:hypothetical protein
MSASHLTRGQSLYLASALILSLGCAAALLVFLTASPDADPDIVGYRLVDGRVIPVTIEHSARTVQTLEAVGGRINVDAAVLDAWIGSLWHGRRLAYTLAATTLFLAGLCACAARLTTEGR